MESIADPISEEKQPGSIALNDGQDPKPHEESNLLQLLDQSQNLNNSYKVRIESLMAENESLRKVLSSKDNSSLPTPSSSTEFKIKPGNLAQTPEQDSRQTSRLSLVDLLTDQSDEDEAKLLLSFQMNNMASQSSQKSAVSDKFPPRLMIDTRKPSLFPAIYSSTPLSGRSMGYRSSFFQTPISPISSYPKVSSHSYSSPMKKMRLEERTKARHSCASCSSPNPFGYWVKDFGQENTFYCQLCFAAKNPKFADIIVESTRVAKCESCERKVANGMLPYPDCLDCESAYSYRCDSCHNDESSGAWYRDGVSKDSCLCQRCYHVRCKARIDTAPDGTFILRTCVNCSAPKSSSWYRDSNVPNAYICKHCYNHRYQARIDVNHDRKCGTCYATQSSTWVKDPTKPGEYVCKKCYHQLDKFRMVLKSDGSYGLRECSGCETTISSRWYKDIQHSGLYNCVRCYNLRKKSLSDSN